MSPNPAMLTWPATQSVFQLTIPAGKVASSLDAFVVRVDLGHAPAAWWSGVTAGGIRVRNQAGAIVPADIIFADAASGSGDMYFKTNLLSESDNKFNISFDSSLSAPTVSDPVGRNAVWLDYAVVLMGSSINRTGGIAATSVGSGATVGGYQAHAISPELIAHQGIAADDDYFYVISTNSVHKYTRTWSLVASNTNVLSTAGLTSPYNHVGDGFAANGLLYVPVSKYPATGGLAEQIVVLSCVDLSFVNRYEVTSKGYQLASLCTDGEYIYSVGHDAGADYSTKIQKWTFEATYVGSMALPSALSYMQGITFHNGEFWVTTGSADDSLYRISTTLQLILTMPSDELEGVTSHGGILYYLHMHNTSLDLSYVYEMVESPTALRFDGAGCLRFAAVGDGTTWTIGASASLAGGFKHNYAIAGMDMTGSSGETNRASLVADYDVGGNTWGLWNSTNLWLRNGVPLVGPHSTRVNAVHNGAVSRSIWRNGTSVVGGGVSERPVGNSDSLIVGAGTVNSFWTNEPLVGSICRFYMRYTALTSDWLTAEYTSWETPASFYYID